MKRACGLMLLATLCLSGCAVTFEGSAPAAGGRYVAGSKANRKTIFYCPDAPDADCEPVEVEYK